MRKISLLIFATTLFGCRTEIIKKEIYLIPQDFIGTVVIIYNQANGIKDSIINDEVIYKVPKNGILYLKGHQHLQQFKDMKYHFYPYKATNAPICDHSDKDATKNCKYIVWGQYLGSFQKDLESKRYEYTVIFIGSKDSIPPDFDPSTFQFEK